MSQRCPHCAFLNFAHAPVCKRCGSELTENAVDSANLAPSLMSLTTANSSPSSGAYASGHNGHMDKSGTETVTSVRGKVLKRLLLAPAVAVIFLAGFYGSLISTSDPLDAEQRATVERAIDILQARGFAREVKILRRVTVFRSTDHWFNGVVKPARAYAATNFPFEIMTLYSDFFDKTADDTERAAVLLHEAQHLYGANEKKAYEYVWRNKTQLGWTHEVYSSTRVWKNVADDTFFFCPYLFRCGLDGNGDCME